jgi:hypothetical protein
MTPDASGRSNFRPPPRQHSVQAGVPETQGGTGGWHTLLSIREYLIPATVAPSLCLDCFPPPHREDRTCAVQCWDWHFSVLRRWEHPPRPLPRRTNNRWSGQSIGMAATVARDARSTDRGDMNAGKRVVTTGITASGRGVLTVTTPSQDLTVTTRRRVIRADCVPH